MTFTVKLVCLIFSAVVAAEGACWDNKDCESCSRDSEWWVSCRWCPLTNGCHAYGSGQFIAPAVSYHFLLGNVVKKLLDIRSYEIYLVAKFLETFVIQYLLIYDWFFFPVYNDCSSSQQITRSRSCGNVAEPTLTYSPETAEKLAKWSSLSYITPGISDEANTQNVVRSQIGDNYRVRLSKPLCHAHQPRGNKSQNLGDPLRPMVGQ